MKATVLNVFDTGKSWDNKKGKIFKIYKVEMSNAKEYETFDDLNTKIGQEVEFNEEQTQYGWKLRVVRDQQQNFPAKTGFQRPQSDPKTMYMSYSKDIIVAMIEAKLIKDGTDAQTWLCDTYDVIMKKVGE